ncbi:uncharacterized [Tachysurus ichikawai]
MQNSHMTMAWDGPHRVGFDMECGKDVQVVGGGPQGCRVTAGFFQNLPSFPYPFSNFLSSRSYPQPVMADRQMAGSRALDLPVRTAGGFPLTLKQRVAFVSPTVT